jgi:ferrochelatase
MLTAKYKTAVVLFQLGGPDSLDAVGPFLYNLFMDPDIIDFPLAFLSRRLLAKFISSKRSLGVQNNYTLIGGKSPILDLTRLQAHALETHLSQQNIDTSVFIAMRYWHPLTERVIREIKAGGFEQVVLLPLYPQFSKATTYSSLNEWNRQAKKHGLTIPTRFVCCYPNHPLLVEAFVDNINRSLEKFISVAPDEIEFVFSAHGVPVNYIQKGDPYQLQVEETVHRVVELGQWKFSYTLCYQSKVGPMKWLKPSLLETVKRLAHEGRKHLLVIPIAFVTDHIETLHEINIEVRNFARAQGIRQFELMPALNDHPKFIKCLAELVQSQLLSDVQQSTCNTLWKTKQDSFIPNLCPWIQS